MTYEITAEEIEKDIHRKDVKDEISQDHNFKYDRKKQNMKTMLKKINKGFLNGI